MDAVLIFLAIAIIVLQMILLFRRSSVNFNPVLTELDFVKNSQERTERTVKSEIAENRKEAQDSSFQARQELAQNIIALTTANEQKLEQMRQDSLAGAKGMREEVGNLTRIIEERLRFIQEENTKQLEKMRATVDEKLQGTLEKRLGESFRQVSERLEQVYKGLGEMQVLATGVGDLKMMLSNVKTRGTWGEVQLGAMLEQILIPDQYAVNVSTKNNNERVEYAVRLPGKGDSFDDIVLLPIDAKFPIADYQRLVEVKERADLISMDSISKQLESQIKKCARDICEKYLNPPKTTDFGILYLPIEGLYAEIIGRTGLMETIQRECRVVIAGPTTLWAILSGLQMGFKTLAIQKRSSEVWNLLAAVKTEWSKYGEILERLKKKLDEATRTVEDAEKRTRVIGKKLRDVQELPTEEATAVLMVESEMKLESPVTPD